MAHVERPIKDYRPDNRSVKKNAGLQSRDYRVEETPILWHSENNNLIYQAFMALQAGLVAVPLIAGMDKFVNILGNWTEYLAPIFPNVLGVSAQTFMYGVGVVEILIAMGVALWPRIFSNVLLVWVGLVILNLLMTGQYFDIVLRDFGLAAAAYALSRLSQIKEEVPVVVAEPNDFSTPELAH
jgi:hypothetical protein